MRESLQPQPTSEAKSSGSPPLGSSSLSDNTTNSMLIKLFHTQAAHQIKVNKVKQ